MHFKNHTYIQNLKFLTLQQFHLPKSLPVCLPAIRPSSTMAKASVFSTIKVMVSDLRNCCSKESLFTVPLCLFLLLGFCLQIAYKNVKNLQIGVNKLVGKVPINLLLHAKLITSHKVSCLCYQHNYRWFRCQSCTP